MERRLETGQAYHQNSCKDVLGYKTSLKFTGYFKTRDFTFKPDVENKMEHIINIYSELCDLYKEMVTIDYLVQNKK